jgi:photosystem II stability/assembly factor-like uncharacterized protein
MESPLDLDPLMQPALYAVAGDAHHVMAVGDGGTLLQFDRQAETWSPAPYFPTGDVLFGVWSPPTGGEFFAVGIDSGILYFDGAAWSPMEPLPACRGRLRTLNAVCGTSRTNVIAVGDRGCVLRFTGRMPAPVTDEP